MLRRNRLAPISMSVARMNAPPMNAYPSLSVLGMLSPKSWAQVKIAHGG